MAGKPIQLILARQLASSVAIPIMLFDADGSLVFFNEPAEAILGERFDETGEISSDDFVNLVEVADEHRVPLHPDDRPSHAARRERRPMSRIIWTRSRSTEWRRLQITAVPLLAGADEFLGVMHLFWEI
jgi:PAS domain-containing protein